MKRKQRRGVPIVGVYKHSERYKKNRLRFIHCNDRRDYYLYEQCQPHIETPRRAPYNRICCGCRLTFPGNYPKIGETKKQYRFTGVCPKCGERLKKITAIARLPRRRQAKKWDKVVEKFTS